MKWFLYSVMTVAVLWCGASVVRDFYDNAVLSPSEAGAVLGSQGLPPQPNNSKCLKKYFAQHECNVAHGIILCSGTSGCATCKGDEGADSDMLIWRCEADHHDFNCEEDEGPHDCGTKLFTGDCFYSTAEDDWFCSPDTETSDGCNTSDIPTCV